MIDIVTVSDIDYKKVVKSPTMGYLHSSPEVSDGSDLDLYIYWGTEVKEILDESLADPEADFGADPEMLADGIPDLMEDYKRRIDAYIDFLEKKKRIYKVYSSEDAQIRIMIVYRSASGGPTHYFYKDMNLGADLKFIQELEKAASKIVNRKYPRSWTKGSKRDIPAFSMRLNSRPVTLRKVPSGISIIKYQRNRYASGNSMTFNINQRNSVLDNFIQGKEASLDPELEAVMRDDTLPVGSRVAFNASLETLMTYTNHPHHGTKGIVVRVWDKAASADSVWVKWDDGSFGRFRRAHVKKTNGRIASKYSFTTTNMDSLMNTFERRSASTLVHKAKKDLWSFEKVGDQYVIERLFDDTGEPLVEE